MAELKESGKVIAKLDKVTGQSANGEWKKQDIVIETAGEYPKKICFTLWGDKVERLLNINIGDTITVFFNAESREYNDRWFTNLMAWKIEVNSKGGAATPPPANQKQEQTQGEGDLPF